MCIQKFALRYEGFFLKNAQGDPPCLQQVQGGLKNFNLKPLLWGHLLMISFLLFYLKLNVFNCRGSGQGSPQERGVKGGSAPLEATLNIHINQKVLKTFCKTHEYLKKINLVGILIRIFKSCEIVANQPPNPMKIFNNLTKEFSWPNGLIRKFLQPFLTSRSEKSG